MVEKRSQTFWPLPNIKKEGKKKWSTGII